MYRKLGLAILASAVANVAAADYEEVRELTLGTAGIDTLSIEAGAGSLDVVGVSGANEITVTATIRVSENDVEEARERIESDMILTLEKDGDTAELEARMDHSGWGNGGHIQLEVAMPENMHLDVDDGSGSIDIENVRGQVAVEDGSGSLTMTDVGGRLEVNDGSGSITIRNAGGDVSIEDGSGSIEVSGVSGSVTVDDGSGSIDVSDVEQDLTIVNDGSGGLDFSNIKGRVETDT